MYAVAVTLHLALEEAMGSAELIENIDGMLEKKDFRDWSESARKDQQSG